MSTKHTPGPWKVAGRAIETENGETIAVAATYFIPQSEAIGWEGDAALIARAPDLLAEVERLRAALEYLLRQADNVRIHTVAGAEGDALVHAWVNSRDHARAALARKGE
jgi:hypothetical protein